ncbi:Uncharacterised protein [Brucella anthropi]|nr:Uncharacterised protein [Brucella anthropi]
MGRRKLISAAEAQNLLGLADKDGLIRHYRGHSVGFPLNNAKGEQTGKDAGTIPNRRCCLVLINCSSRQRAPIRTPPAAAASTTIQGTIFHVINSTKQVSARANWYGPTMALVKTGS